MTRYIGKQPIPGQVVQTDYWISDGSNKYKLKFSPASTKSVIIYYDGIPLVPEKEYNVDSNGNLTFVTPPAVGTKLQAYCSVVTNISTESIAKNILNVKNVSTVVSETGVTNITLTASPNETVELHLNGLLRERSKDYYLNGNIVQFYFPLNKDDIINVRWFEYE